jgi:hypothetical protein
MYIQIIITMPSGPPAMKMKFYETNSKKNSTYLILTVFYYYYYYYYYLCNLLYYYKLTHSLNFAFYTLLTIQFGAL